ncbi:MAG TPA: MMPL family transporter [Actinophytocola sp.]|uniref:MMPL family transporter n=1 Tax=Actinophytocola sp. TaxID=1872138 RepID=UPI002DDCEA44|nr:MMPL family transporter [Actinophytocola sp.]HEV2783208.1 MMPL family transporter [Actinophytocola sp.]
MRADNQQPATVRVARWSATHPWRAIGLWVVFVAACFAVGGMAGTNEATDADERIGESGRASAIHEEGNFHDPAKENVLITARDGTLDPAAAAAAADVAERMRQRPEVAGVGEPVPARDGSALLVPLTISGDAKTAGERVQALLDQTAAAQRDYPQLRVEQVGDASIGKGITEQVGTDLARAELLSLPVTLIIMIIVFGAIIAAGVPVLLAMSAVGAAFGLSALASHVIPAVDSVNSVILLMGMAVGVDYSLFYLKREREERERLDEGHGRHVAAVEIAAATAGRAVVVSGLAVIVSMAGLYLANDAVFASLGTGSIIVVAVAVLGSLTVLPALLAKLGRWVDRPRIPLLWKLTNRQGPPKVWPALLRPALRYPAVTLIVSTGAMVALALPALDLNLRSASAETLPKSIPVVAAYDRLTAAFPSEGASHLIAVRAPAERSGEVRAALAGLVDRARGNPLFAQDARPEIRTSADGRVSLVRLATPYDENSPEAVESLRVVRQDLLPATVGRVAGAEHAVGGGVAGNVDYRDNQSDTLPLVIGFVLLLTFLVMALTFRSLVIALSALVLNALSAAAAFGVLSLVFQHTWAEGLLGFESNGAIIAWIPLFVFVVLVGLSMDYHVFAVSRIREAALRGMPTKAAVAHGITRSAGVVTSAAVVMMSVFAVFAFLSMVEMKEMGVGLATAVFLDAMVIRVLVLPSLMALLGRANWWPSHAVARAQGKRSPVQVDSGSPHGVAETVH